MQNEIDDNQNGKYLTKANQKELFDKINTASNIINNGNREGKANYISIPTENIKYVANAMNVSIEEACILIEKYFKG